ncbi:hypothetical protein ACFQ71_36030 [Streptomyces sp. NPDC056534]|uniref:hypothetical protein n=1 Tax=Streptomyces sp. NPDC056534 TaxID=3345857 RepID=UPI00367606F2
MTENGRPHFLLIGSHDQDFSVNKLKVAGVRYRRKSLYSEPENWGKIVQILEDPSLSAVIVKLTGNIFHYVTRHQYAEISHKLFEALGKKPHLVMVHSSVLDGAVEEPEGLLGHDEDPYDHDTYMEYVRRTYLEPPDEETRERVLGILARHGISLTPYVTNAEMVTLAGSFIDDHERNLLFRIYVPAGRLYASEADKLLRLFHDWLTQVGRNSIRQDGYSTAAGRVYEFFGDESLVSSEMTRQFSDFSNFLDLCAKDPDAAEDELFSRGVGRGPAADIVVRYGKSVRRINTDLRHERESRILAIRHRLESELLDMAEGEVDAELAAVVESLVPGAATMVPLQALSPSTGVNVMAGANVTINQQIVHHIEGTVLQSVQGTVNLGTEAKELLELIASHGGQEAASLETDVLELEDPDARQADRLGAKARLSGFLVRLKDSVEGAGLAVLQKYLESKLSGLL